MVDPISNATSPREIGPTQSRPQASPQIPGTPDPATDLGADQRVGLLQAAVEKLIRQSLPTKSKLQIVRDKKTGSFIYRAIDAETGEVISQYPPEEFMRMHDYLATMEGMLIDTEA